MDRYKYFYTKFHVCLLQFNGKLEIYQLISIKVQNKYWFHIHNLELIFLDKFSNVRSFTATYIPQQLFRKKKPQNHHTTHIVAQ